MEIFYKNETFKIEVELNDSAGEPILISDLEDVAVELQVNKKTVAKLTIDNGISEGDQANKIVLEVDAEDTVLWNTGRLEGIFLFEIDGITTIEKKAIFKIKNK